MVKFLAKIGPKTDSLIDQYQETYRQLNGTKVSRSYVIDKVFEEKAEDIKNMISEMETLIKKREQLA